MALEGPSAMVTDGKFQGGNDIVERGRGVRATPLLLLLGDDGLLSSFYYEVQKNHAGRSQRWEPYFDLGLQRAKVR